MTRNYSNLREGRNNLVNGVFALMIISLIVLGCTCNDEEGFKLGGNDSDSAETTKESSDDTKRESDSDDDGTFTADEDEVPTNSQAEALVQSTLLRFNKAVEDKDFSDFRDSVSKRWRDTSKTSDFDKGFKEFIDKEIDISRIKGEDPEFSPKPYIDKKYGKEVLFLKGTYDTSPLPVNFNLEYIVEDDEWKLVFIGVDTRRK